MLQTGDISVGSVIESAKKMFVLVPVDSPLEVEAEIRATDQGYVKVGQKVQLKLDAWPYAKHGMAEGIVRTISGDSFTQNPQSGAPTAPVYLAKVDITKVDLKGTPSDFRLVPGMPLTADVVVGAETLMNYVLSSAIPVLTEGMREP